MSTTILCLKNNKCKAATHCHGSSATAAAWHQEPSSCSKQKLHRVPRENAFCTKSWNSWSQKTPWNRRCHNMLHSNFLATCATWRYMMVHALHAMSTRPLEWSHHLCSCPSLRRKLKRSLQWPVACRFNPMQGYCKINSRQAPLYYVLYNPMGQLLKLHL